MIVLIVRFVGVGLAEYLRGLILVLFCFLCSLLFTFENGDAYCMPLQNSLSSRLTPCIYTLIDTPVPTIGTPYQNRKN